MNPILRYRCDKCGMIYDTDEGAKIFCPPDISEVYECECGTSYSDKAAAEECCMEDEDE